jgi:hypothetical protein
VLEADPELAVAYGLFSVRQARAAGHSRADIERQVRRGIWYRRARGVLERSGRAEQTHDHLLLAVLTAGPQAVIGFAGAGQVHGWQLGSLPWTPTVVLPPAGHSRGSVPAYRTTLARDDVVLHGLLPVTSPVCTAVHLVEFLPLTAAVISLDCAFRSRQVTHHEISSVLAVRRGHGIVRAHKALELSDPLSGSVIESEARLLFHDAGLPSPTTQHVVREGELKFLLDFAWPELMVLVEIDGREWHIGRGPFQRDRTKQNALVQAGWLVLRFTVEDVRLRPAYVIDQIRRALDR